MKNGTLMLQFLIKIQRNSIELWMCSLPSTGRIWEHARLEENIATKSHA